MNEQASGDKNAPVTTGANEDAAQDLENLREILFGGQRREFDERLRRLEEQLTTETAELRAEIKSALEPIESYGREEIRALNDRLREQESLRISDIHATEERANQRMEELRSHLEERTKLLSDELRRKEEMLAGATRKAIKELELRKVDRDALAGLLSQTALHVGRERTGEGRYAGGDDQEKAPGRHH
jgi:hypothetical protein